MSSTPGPGHPRQGLVYRHRRSPSSPSSSHADPPSRGGGRTLLFGGGGGGAPYSSSGSSSGSSPSLLLSEGVRGTGGAVSMERSQEEKQKFPDRINLDRKGLHGIPILEDEPALRLLSLQHNLIKRVQHLDATYRLVFLDLYHNRLDTICNLEPLVNLRVLMLGKNRIRRIEGLTRCARLSVLDLHGNRITQIGGLDHLGELKVLNLAGNLIRKLSHLDALKHLEELNVRRNRIRSTAGIEAVATIEKLYMSNNEIQGIASLQNMDMLTRLHTVQMEGNPVWSSGDYAFHLITSLPALKVLDQQEVMGEMKQNAQKWREKQMPAASAPVGGAAAEESGAARKQLLKRMEERNVSITNAKMRWNFLKKQNWKDKNVLAAGGDAAEAGKEAAALGVAKDGQQEDGSRGQGSKPLRARLLPDGDFGAEEDAATSSPLDDDTAHTATTTETDNATSSTASAATLSPSYSTPQLALSLSRQASRNNLMAGPGGGKLQAHNASLSAASPARRGNSRSSRSSPGSPSTSNKLATEGRNRLMPPQQQQGNFAPLAIRNEYMKRKFPGLYRRKLAIPQQKYMSLQTMLGGGGVNDVSTTGPTLSTSAGTPAPAANKAAVFMQLDKKIGFFNTPPVEDGQSTSDEFSGAGLLSDSSSDSSSSDGEDDGADGRSAMQRSPSQQSLRRADLSSRRAFARPLDNKQGVAYSERPAGGGMMRQLVSRHGTPSKQLPSGGAGSPSSSPSSGVGGAPSFGGFPCSPAPHPPPIAPSTTAAGGEAGGRTSEQGRDFLIELDGDLLSVYGLRSLKFLDRPWNRQRALKATTVQFNFVAFDDLVPYLDKFRMAFPNVVNMEFLETDINCLGQLNALALTQGIVSLYIGDDGNPISHKSWRSYAIFRLEHWGLQYINNTEVTAEEIVEANRAFGCLGELAVMVVPQNHIAAIIRRLDLMSAVKDESCPDLLSSVRDPHVREVVAKEALQYRAAVAAAERESATAADLERLRRLLRVGHSAVHKLARLEAEWAAVLPILIKRIVAQYSDIRQYKKESLGRLEQMERH